MHHLFCTTLSAGLKTTITCHEYLCPPKWMMYATHLFLPSFFMSFPPSFLFFCFCFLLHCLSSTVWVRLKTILIVKVIFEKKMNFIENYSWWQKQAQVFLIVQLSLYYWKISHISRRNSNYPSKWLLRTK